MKEIHLLIRPSFPFVPFNYIHHFISPVILTLLNISQRVSNKKHGLESGHEVISIDTYHVCFWMQRFCQPLTRLVFCAPIAFAFVLITSFWPT
jgi:hypothetical protein